MKRFKRSRTGCRTCRVRRIKCDEALGACNNCVRAKRVCEGYDAHRIPTASGPHKSSNEAAFAKIHADIAPRLQWKVTSDEGRCLVFFQYQSVPQLVTLFKSPLWQRLVLQLCYSERAVFHAAVALGAVNQAREIARGRLYSPGKRQDLEKIWSLFALEQSGRSFALLTKRPISEDPQLQTVILVCCLLFIVCELMHKNIRNALFHVEGGLQIVKSMNIRRHTLDLKSPNKFEECVIETFLALQASSVFFGIKPTIHIDPLFVYEQRYDRYLRSFTSLQHARDVLRPLTNTLCLYVTQWTSGFQAEIITPYYTMQLISYFTKFLQLFEAFCTQTYGTSRFINTDNAAHCKEWREAELTRLSSLSSILALKMSLYSKSHPLPLSIVPECEAVIEAAEIAMRKFHGQSPRPILMANHGIVPALCIGTHRCPDYGVRCRGIEAMRSWQSEETFMNPILISDMLEEGLKLELQQLYYSAANLPPGVTFEMCEDGQVIARITYRVSEEEKQHCLPLAHNEGLINGLRAIDNSHEWPYIRSLGLLETR